MANKKDEKKVEAGRIGARARDKALTSIRKSEIGRQAALTRWSNDIPRALNEGILKIGNTEIECAVIEGGIRVINQESFLRAIGRSRSPKAGTGSAGSLERVDAVPPFLAAENLKPFITDELRQSTAPIMYRTLQGGVKAFGYNALLLPQVCEVYLRLKDSKQYNYMQRHVIEAAYSLMRGLAHVGILALVDKATGFDQEEQKRELLLIVEKYVAKELMPWTKRYPEEFFRELYRLREWVYTGSSKRTPFVGHLINKYIHERLPPGVLEEMRRRNPVAKGGRRKHKHYQFLTGETGIPHLDEQIRMVTMLMRVSDTQEQFEAMFEKAFSKQKRLHFVPVSLSGPFRKKALPGEQEAADAMDTARDDD